MFRLSPYVTAKPAMPSGKRKAKKKTIRKALFEFVYQFKSRARTFRKTLDRNTNLD